MGNPEQRRTDVRARAGLTTQSKDPFDGDTCSLTLCYTEEALAEINNHLNSKEAYLDTQGGLRTSANVQTVALVIRNMTGDD